MIFRIFFCSSIVVTSLIASVVLAQSARDQIRIVGSSTVYPFATTVAEQLAKTTHLKAPVVESTGSGGGIKLFCSGVGIDHPDITNASRRIKKSELTSCARNGVTDIIEVRIGYDGIVLAHAKTSPQLRISRAQIFLALAKQIPKNSNLVDNPYETWQEIDASLPANKIEVLGPPPTSGTRDAFVELVMDSGCKMLPELQALAKENQKRFQTVCQMVREDGAFIEAGENDNLIVQKLKANPKAFGIFGFSFLDQNTDQLQGVVVDEQLPTFEHISDGRYPLLRPLYFYIKQPHLRWVPNLKEYIAEFTSEKACGENGYLTDKGLIPLPSAERKAMRGHIERLTNLRMFLEGGLNISTLGTH